MRVLIAVFVPLAIAPLFVQDAYLMHVLVLLCLNVMLASSLRFLMLGGEVSFAHAGFAAVGAYTAGALSVKANIPFWLTVPAAGFVAILLAVVVGYPTLRLKGAYFFLASFAFSEVARLFFNNFFMETFGGTNGVVGIPAPPPITLPGLPDIVFGPKRGVAFFYLVWLIAVCSLLFLHRLEHTRFGALLGAIRQSDILAHATGISVAKYKLLAFVVSCFFAGVVGSLIAHLNVVITPDDFVPLQLSLMTLVYAVVGGSTVFGGPIIGAALLTLLSIPLGKLGYFQSVAYGLALILVMVFLPTGLAGLPAALRNWFGRKKLPKEEVAEVAAS